MTEEVLTPEEAFVKYGQKPWSMTDEMILFPVVDPEAGLVEIYEYAPTRWSGFLGAKKAVYRSDQDPLFVEVVEPGPVIRRYRIGEAESQVVAGSKIEAVERVQLSEDTVSITFAGVGGMFVTLPCFAYMKGYVKKTTFHELSQAYSRVTIDYPRLEKLTIAVDDTDTSEDGATTTLCDNIARQLAAEGDAVRHLYLTVTYLYPLNPLKTQNNATTAMALAVQPESKEMVVERVRDWLTEHTLTDDTAMAVLEGIVLPPGLKEMTKTAKARMVEIKEARDAAEAEGVQVIEISGQQGIVGAVSGLGFSDNPGLAARPVMPLPG